MCKIHIYIDSKRFRQINLKLGQNGVLRHGYWSNFRDRMANLGLIDFKIGLHSKITVNTGQNKFEVHI